VPVNAAPGLLFEKDGAVAGVAVVTIVAGRITEIYLIVNRDELRHLTPPSERTGDGASDRRHDRDHGPHGEPPDAHHLGPCPSFLADTGGTGSGPVGRPPARRSSLLVCTGLPPAHHLR